MTQEISSPSSSFFLFLLCFWASELDNLSWMFLWVDFWLTDEVWTFSDSRVACVCVCLWNLSQLPFFFIFYFYYCSSHKRTCPPPSSSPWLTGLSGVHPPGAVCDPLLAEGDDQSASLASELARVRHGNHRRADPPGEVSTNLLGPFYAHTLWNLNKMYTGTRNYSLSSPTYSVWRMPELVLNSLLVKTPALLWNPIDFYDSLFVY